LSINKSAWFALAALAVASVTAGSVIPSVAAQDAGAGIPAWIKNNAQLWSEGMISDSEYLNAIKYLVENQVIRIGQQPSGTSAGIGADSITIGFIPVEKAEELTPKAEALEQFLEERLAGTDVQLVIPTNYETIIEGMRFGHIDAAFMDAGPGWITHQRTGAEAVLAEVVGGKINYQATVWAKADNDSLQTIEDTVGKRVAFTSITGSSGFVRPMGALVTSGAVPVEGSDIIALENALANSFEDYTFAGGYKAALTLLLEDRVDAAFGSDIAPQKYLELHEQQQLRPVTTVGPVPSHVFMVSPSVSEESKRALVDALVDLNYDENNEILRGLYGAEALLPTTTSLHIGEFGGFIDALVGLDQKILDKYDKSK